MSSTTTQRSTADEQIEHFVGSLLLGIVKSVGYLLWFTKVTLLWALVFWLIYRTGEYSWAYALLVVIAPLFWKKTRPYGIFVFDYVQLRKYLRKRSARKKGNESLRYMGLVSQTDEEDYKVYLYEGKQQSKFLVDQIIPGTAPDQIKDKIRSFKTSFDAQVLMFKDLPKGCLEATMIVEDNLAGAREVPAQGNSKARVARLQDGSDGFIDLKEAYHIGIQGQTRSGKSALSYGLLVQAHEADDVEIWGIDPNRVLLSPFFKIGESDRFAVGKDLDGAVDVLERFVAEMDRRMGYIDKAGKDKISAFSSKMPVKLLVLEEYASLIRDLKMGDSVITKKDEKRHPKVEMMVARLVSEGAKVGMRVLIIVQRADSGVLETSTRAQLGTRITMRVDNPEAMRMFHPGLDEDLSSQVLTFPRGRMIFEQAGHRVVGQSDFLGAGGPIDDEDYLYREYQKRLGVDVTKLMSLDQAMSEGDEGSTATRDEEQGETEES